MTDEKTSPSMSDEDILQRAEMINEARKLEQEEKLRQAEAERAAEEARKAEELKRARELVKADEKSRPKKHTGLKVFLIIIAILIVACGVAVISLDVTSTDAPITPMPYQASYMVYLHQGDTYVAGTTISVVGDANQMMITLPGAPTSKIFEGDKLAIGTKKLVVTIFWKALQIYDCIYAADLTYMGVSTDNLVTFKTVISTNKQIPEWLMNIGFSLSGIKYAKY